MHVRTELVCLVLSLVLALAGCAAPILTPDGQLVFAEKGGTRGASVLTAHGILFLDRSDVPPQPIARRRADEPWAAPTGFLLPADGVWRETSTPTALSGRGLLVMVRPSDVLVPSWGGEVLIRIDALVPPDAFPEAREASLRKPLDVVLVLEGRGGELEAMIEAATDGLGQRDRIAVVRTDPPRLVVPWLPGTHRTLVRAAAALAAKQPKASRASGDIERAVAMADQKRRRGSPRKRAIYLSSSVPTAPRSAEAKRLGLEIPQGTTVDERAAWLADAVPPPGDVVLHDVALTIASDPAPARIIEPSGGDPTLALDHDQLYLGDMYVGEARTEVVRVALPVWVPGKPLELSVSATYSLADGRPLRTVESIPMRFSSDVEALASKRHGDVIAYASALAMVRRLDRAFLRGSAAEPSETADLRSMALWQARSLRDLAALRDDRALATQAEILTALVDSLDR